MKKNRLNLYGFTIVELLIVIVIIGVLVGITLMSYSGIIAKANVSSIKSDLGSASKLVSVYRMFSGSYPTTLAEANDNKPMPVSSGTSYDGYYPTADGYCITATRGSLVYRITNDMEARPGSCSGTSRDSSSLLKWDAWTVGTGSVACYTTNGDGNSRINDFNPWNKADVIWDVSNQDVAFDADGGFNTCSFAIDDTKLYRYSVFVRKKVLGDGRFYFGAYGVDGVGATINVLRRNSGAVTANPYFTDRLYWGNANEWYLTVGFIWPSGSGTGATKPTSGVYTMSGTKLFSNDDFVWQSATPSAKFRTYLYNAVDTTTNQQFYRPRVDLVDGTEPSIEELLADSF